MLYRTPDPPYNEQQLRYKRQWQARQATKRDNPYIAYDRAEEAQRKAQTQRDIAENEHELKMERAAFKGIQAARVAPDAYEGLACVYGVVDAHGDRFHPGCFKEARGVEYWFDHNETYGRTADILALWEIGRKELPLVVQLDHPEATGGLVVVRRYRDDGNGPAAKAWIQDGIKGISVSFRPERTTTRTTNGRTVRDIHRADLWEISDARNGGVVPGVIPVTGFKQLSLLEGSYRRG
jgi:hypothetical protein